MSYYCECDYDLPSLFKKYIVKSARKDHQCCECQRTIKLGETYEYTFGVWNGVAQTFKTCEQCQEIKHWAIESYEESNDCFCWHYGRMLSDVREYANEIARDVPGITMQWGRRMIAIRRAGGNV